MAVLELLAGAAGAGLVAADPAPGGGVVGIALERPCGSLRRRAKPSAARRAKAAPCGMSNSFSPVAGRDAELNMGGSAAARLLEHDLDAHELARHLLAQVADAGR